MKFVYIASSVAAVLYLGQLAAALVISSGSCPKRPVQLNFNASRYTGLWYEIRRYEQIFQLGGECVTAQYSLNRDGSVRVFNSLITPPSQKRTSIVGRATLCYPNKAPLPAQLEVTFTGVPVASNYMVLDTDYDNFAVVWSCFQIGSIIHTEGAWILSRELKLNVNVVPRVQYIVNKYLDEKQLRKTIQDNNFCCSTERKVTTYPACKH